MERPYQEQVKDGYYYRTFSDDVSIDELVWHRDKEDRIVTVLQETDWLFQMDDDVPKKMEGEIYIPKECWHRVIKGTGKLNIKIKKL